MWSPRGLSGVSTLAIAEQLCHLKTKVATSLRVGVLRNLGLSDGGVKTLVGNFSLVSAC